MNNVRRIAKNALALTIADIVSKLLSFLLIIYIARYLGDVGFGKYSFAFAFSNFFLIFVDIGLNYLFVRDVARDKTKAQKYLGNVLIIKTILAILVLMVMVLVVNLIQYPPDTSRAVYIVSFSLIIGSISSSIHSIFNAYEKMEYPAIISTVEKIIFVGTAVPILIFGYGLIPLLLMYMFASIANLFISGFIVCKKFTAPKFDIDYILWKYLIKTALPFLLTFVFASIYFYIDTIMLSFMKGDAVVGWYNAAYNLLSALIPILALLMNTMFPVFSRLFQSSANDLNMAFSTSVRYLFIFTLPIVVGTTLISENIIYFLYGEVFVESILTLQILIWALLFISISIVLYTLLNSTNRQMLVTKATAFGALINVSLNLLLIPKMSLIGAAIATLITEAFLFAVYFYLVSKFQPIASIHRIIFKPIVAVSVMAVSIQFINEMNIFLIVIIAAFIYIGVLIGIKGFTKSDVDMLRQIVKG